MSSPEYRADGATGNGNQATFIITNPQYTGNVYCKVKFTWNSDWEKLKEGISSEDVFLYFVFDDLCKSSSTIFNGTNLELVKGGVDKTWEANAGNAIWAQQNKPTNVCVPSQLKLSFEPTNTETLVLGELRLLSYGTKQMFDDDDPIAPNGSTRYEVRIGPSESTIIPLYSCPPKSVFPDASLPLWSSESIGCGQHDPQIWKSNANNVDTFANQQSSSKLIWIHAGKNDNAPSPGSIVSANFVDPPASAGESQQKEYYVVGAAASTTDDFPWQSNSNKTPYSFHESFTAPTPGGNDGQRYTKASTRILSDLIEIDGYQIPKVSFVEQESSDCDNCWKKYESKSTLLYDDLNASVLHDAGFRLGMTQTAFSKGILRHSNSDPKAPVPSEDIIWTEQVKAGFKREKMFSLPGGMGTRIYAGGMTDLQPPEDYHITMNNPLVFTWHLQRAISHQYAMHRVVKGTLRRSFNVPDGGYIDVGDEGEIYIYDANGDRVQESVKLTVSELETAITQAMTTQSAMGMSLAKEDYFSCGFTYNMSATQKSGEDSLGGSITQEETWSASLNAKFFKLVNWAAKTPGGVAINQNEEFNSWKDDVLDISVDLGSGGTKSGVEWTNATSIDADGNVSFDPTHPTISNFNDQFGDDKYSLKIKSISANYSATIFNGWDFNISGIGAEPTQDGSWDLTTPGDWTYTVGGNIKSKLVDDLRWTAERSPSGIKLGIGCSLDLIEKMKDSGWNIPGLGSGNWKASTMSLGLTVDDHSAGKWSITPKATMYNNVAGFEHGINLIDGSQYVKKGFSKSFKNHWAWLKDNGYDDFKINFCLRADQAMAGHGNLPSIFSGNADATLNKRLVEFGEIGGRLNFSAKVAANIGNVNSQSAAAALGWNVSANITWENNILKWFGFPFNIHPGIDIYGGGFFQFGGYTDDNGKPGPGKNIPDIGGLSSEYKSKHVYSFGFSGIKWNISYGDTFRDHLMAQHNSVFGWLGLGQCPVLKRLGTKEPIWKYILRVAPINALAALNDAASTCAKNRKSAFESNYNAILNVQRNMPAFFSLQYGPAASNQYRYGAPICGCTSNPNPKARYAGVDAKDPRAKKIDMDDEEALQEAWKDNFDAPDGNCYPSWHNMLAQDALLSVSGGNNPSWSKSKDGKLDSPFPCLMTRYQTEVAANILTLKWDDSNSKCACIRAEYAKKTRKLQDDNYDFQAWQKELDGSSAAEEGVRVRGLEVIEAFVLDFALHGGIDPTQETKIEDHPKFEDVTEPPDGFEILSGKKCKGHLTCAECFNKLVHAELVGVVNTIDPQDPAERQEIMEEIDQWANAESNWWNDEGVCGGLFAVLKFLLDGVLWLKDTAVGVLKYLNPLYWINNQDDNPAQPVIDNLYDKKNFCASPRSLMTCSGTTPPPGTRESRCYEMYRHYKYYDKVYSPILKFLCTSEDSSGDMGSTALLPTTATHYIGYQQTEEKNQHWNKWKSLHADGTYGKNISSNQQHWPIGIDLSNATSRALAAKFLVRELANDFDLQKHYLKTVLVAGGINTGSMVGTKNSNQWGQSQLKDVGTITASNMDYAKVMDAHPTAAYRKLHRIDGYSVTHETPNAVNFAQEVSDYVNGSGGSKSMHNLDLDCATCCSDTPCCDHGGIESEFDDADVTAEGIMYQEYLPAPAGTDNIYDEDLSAAANDAGAVTWKAWLDSENAKDNHDTARDRAKQLSFLGNQGLGRQRSQIIEKIKFQTLSDPILLYHAGGSCITSDLYNETKYGLNPLYNTFSNTLDEFNSFMSSNTASTRYNTAVAIYNLESYLRAVSVPAIDGIQSNVVAVIMRYLDSIKDAYRSIILQTIIENDMPLKMISYVDPYSNEIATGWGGTDNALLTSNARAQFSNEMYDLLFGVRSGARIPRLSSLVKSGPWQYQIHTDNASTAQNWDADMIDYSTKLLGAIKADPYVRRYAEMFFVSNGSFANNVSQSATRITELKSNAHRDDSKASGAYYVKMGNDHWNIVQALWHGNSNAWKYDAKNGWGQTLLDVYNCVGSSFLSINPWYADIHGSGMIDYYNKNVFRRLTSGNKRYQASFTIQHAHGCNWNQRESRQMKVKTFYKDLSGNVKTGYIPYDALLDDFNFRPTAGL